MDNRAIGVFDSGLGGLTAVKELERALPGERIVYFGDTGRVPYGSRGRDTIARYALQDTRFLLAQDVKAVLVACATVSSVALPQVTRAAGVPVLGAVEPAAQAAARTTRTGRVGVLGTAATIRSGSFEAALRALLPKAEIAARACPLFVPLVENGYFAAENEVARLVARDYLAEIARSGADTVILGCTHYPLLRGVIAQALPGATLIDAGQELVRAAARLLGREGLLASPGAEDESPRERFFVSDTPEDFERLAGIFLEHPVRGNVERVEIERY